MTSRPPVIRTYGSSRSRTRSDLAVGSAQVHHDSLRSDDATRDSKSLPYFTDSSSSNTLSTVLITSPGDKIPNPKKRAFAEDVAISFPRTNDNIATSLDIPLAVKRERARSDNSPTSPLTSARPCPIRSATTSADPSNKQTLLKSFFIPRPPPMPSSRTKKQEINAIASSSKITTQNPAISTTRKPLHQLHLVPSRNNPTSAQPCSSLYVTCPLCTMSYIRGGIGEDDEILHKGHCDRVTKGVVWTKGMGGELATMDVRIGPVTPRKFGESFVVKVDGRNLKKNSKMTDILESVDKVLSAPALPQAMLAKCKIYLLVTSFSPPNPSSGNKRIKPSNTASKEPVNRVVGCVVAQPIKVAMRVVQETSDVQTAVKNCVIVDHGSQGDGEDSQGSVICYPERLPTHLGIHRLFVIPSYRGLGIAKTLLDAACLHTVYGICCDPTQGHVAFSQPTSSGKAVMDRWGGGAVRVFIEDEQEDVE